MAHNRAFLTEKNARTATKTMRYVVKDIVRNMVFCCAYRAKVAYSDVKRSKSSTHEVGSMLIIGLGKSSQSPD